MISTEHQPTNTPIRQLTICNKYFARSHGSGVCFPVINLCGKWLRDAGFKSGQVINIRCENRRLVITVAKENKFRDE